MKNKITLVAALVLLALTPGMTCHKTYTGIVTITQVRNSAMNELGALSRQGLVSPEVDAKITEADKRYLQAARVCEMALTAYKNGGTQADYLNALQAVRATVAELIAILSPLYQAKAQTLSVDLSKATTL